MKNIKKLRNIFISASIGICTFCSCTSILDQEPIEYPTGKTFWQTSTDASTALSGCYAELRSILLNGDGGMAYFTYGDFPTKIFDYGEWDQNSFAGNYQWYSDSDMADWSKFYKTINSTNLVLEKVAAMSIDKFGTDPALAQQQKNKILGEAYFLRAYTYFYMARIWGQFPLVLKAISSADQAVNDVPYGTNTQVLDQCISDLTQAAKLLSWGYTDSNEKAVRANKGAVYSLFAHLYLWKARPNQKTIDPNWITKAEAACDSVITHGNYQLVDAADYSKIFKGKSDEGIFEINFDVATNEALSQYGFTTYFLAKPILPEYRETPIFHFNPEFLNLFNDEKDLRRTAFFYNFGEGDQCMCAKYSSITFKSADKKSWVTDDNLIIFRLADIYLLRAEALTRMGKYGDARIWLNKVRNRAGLDDFAGTDDGLYYEILKERRRELFLEGQNLYDCVRTGYYAYLPDYSQQRYDGEGYYWPVNSSLFVRNKYVQQTPYWSTRLQ
ncbi:MAG: RagB/SusD family nutrient uptake outer membrane protein [Bacteroidota bacterium]|nr:RagB/SusD family nutrient uptake outer membrane protein [Bacteroidota bacterium]MDP4204463.1 RagB/SusD family nutrient uptake outer membrane protein [Bacteroidota bacterium]